MKSKILFLKTVVILTIMLVLFGCEKNKPEDQNDNQKEITQNSIRITQEAERIVDLAITNSLASSDSIFPDLIVAEIEKIEGVKYTELSPDGTNIKVQQDDGSCINVMIISRDDQRVFELIGNKKVSVDIKQSISKNLLRETPKGNKAIILAPFQSDFKEDLDLIKNTLQSAGFEVVSFLNEKATLEKFHGSFLSDYDVIYITSHGNGLAWTIGGGTFSNIVTGEVISEDQDLIIKNNNWEGIIAKSKKGRYAVTAKWLEETGASFDGSYLFLNSCGSTHYRQNFHPEIGFPQPLIELGAGGINGWDNTIENTIANITAEKLFSYLCDKYSLSGASNMVRSDPEIYDLSFILKIWNIHPSQWEKIETINVQLLTNHKRLSDEPFYIYNEETSVTIPTVTTSSVSDIAETSVTVGGNVTDNGGATVTERGVCWSTSENPETTDNKKQVGSGTGSFSTSVTGLQPTTTYYVRAYAINSEGIAYGSQVSFTTGQSATIPTVTTSSPSDITETSATVGGNVTDNGGATVTERGVCWSTSENPETTDNKKQVGSGTGSFSTSVTGLQPTTTYYVRAYAINSEGIAYGSQVSFTTGQSATIPTVTTSSLSDITETSATVGGNVTDNGGATVTERGIYYSTSASPETTGTKLQIGSGTGTFSTSLTGLTASTTYYIKAYAINNQGEALGSEVSFTTNSGSSNEIGTVTDYDGNTYSTLKIGNQWWMAENLKVTHYANGTAIPLIEESLEWHNLGFSDKAYCYYDNSSSNKDTYGALYTWAAAMNGAASSSINPSGVQGVCPDGWHLPSDAEWTELTDYLGGTRVAGGKLKETGTTHWGSPNTGATNESGFTALSGGYRFHSGTFGGLGNDAHFWSATEDSSSDAWHRSLGYNASSVGRRDGYKTDGFSVRCTKD
ncbi:MAG: hypothetical protein KAX05_14200 [Bacteroidales bacterium]|nr:hypothetical protein [Bacteroidales bacterium]